MLKCAMLTFQLYFKDILTFLIFKMYLQFYIIKYKIIVYTNAIYIFILFYKIF